MIKAAIRTASAATLAGLVPHYLSFYLAGTPLWTDTIAESIMARTPHEQALWLLSTFGDWAKPFAVTGGLATLGGTLCSVILIAMAMRRRAWLVWPAGIGAALVLAYLFGYHSALGQLTFWLPALAACWWSLRPKTSAALPDPSRRRVLAPLVMSSGTVAVALESFARNRALAGRAAETKPLYPVVLPVNDHFATGLVRPLITPTDTFYVMSKNTVDPLLDPGSWRLRVTKDGRTVNEFSYEQLLSLPQQERFVTLRCVSNNLVSDLMGTASWSGVNLHQLVDSRIVTPDIVEIAFIGADGHGDSVRPAYALSDEVMFALGMNGRSLNRNHGFPIRALTPRYYGFRSVKWISEIALCRTPYTGTWQKRGFTREPKLQIASHIDKIRRLPDGGLLVGGVSFAGPRGIRSVQVRSNESQWIDAQLDQSLSPYTLTRWFARLPQATSGYIEARALDGEGHWQESAESPLYPEGVRGPTRRRYTG